MRECLSIVNVTVCCCYQSSVPEFSIDKYIVVVVVINWILNFCQQKSFVAWKCEFQLMVIIHQFVAVPYILLSLPISHFLPLIFICFSSLHFVFRGLIWTIFLLQLLLLFLFFVNHIFNEFSSDFSSTLQLSNGCL